MLAPTPQETSLDQRTSRLPLNFHALGVLPSVSLVERGARYPGRFPVPDRLIPWNVPFDGYAPREAVPNAGAMTKHKPIAASFEGAIEIDPVSGQPRNVMGRTGLSGRGTLFFWGPNHAADILLLRPGSKPGQQEALLIRRNDGQWAFPGGFIGTGEDPIVAGLRELGEEAILNADGVQDLLKDRARLVYQGYADDPRNTDNAWIETSASLATVTREESERLQLRPADGTLQVEWVELTAQRVARLFAGHPHLAAIATHQAPLISATLPGRPYPVRLSSLANLPPHVQRIGLLGGSFDPLHAGHLDVAEGAMQGHRLDAVIFIPAGRNPLKNGPLFTAEERIGRVESAISRFPAFFLSTHEVDQRSADGATYAVDTLRHFHGQLRSGQTLHFLVGADAVTELNRWRDWKECLALAEFIPVKRGGFERAQIDERYGHLGKDVVDGLYRRFLDVPTAPISSTQIREQLAAQAQQ